MSLKFPITEGIYKLKSGLYARIDVIYPHVAGGSVYTGRGMVVPVDSGVVWDRETGESHTPDYQIVEKVGVILPPDPINCPVVQSYRPAKPALGLIRDRVYISPVDGSRWRLLSPPEEAPKGVAAIQNIDDWALVHEEWETLKAWREYRAHREPREWMVDIYEGGHMIQPGVGTPTVERIKVREVFEDD